MLKPILSNSYPERPWKNGRGTTRDIFVFPPNSGDAFLFRLSMADIIESGSFSDFPGVERTLVLLEGLAVTLVHPDLKKEKNLGLFESYCFEGNWKTEVIVSGKGLDFNLMCRKGDYKGEVNVYRLSNEEELELSFNKHFGIIFCGAGNILATQNGEQANLKQYDSLQIMNSFSVKSLVDESIFLAVNLCKETI
jgi:hypothetical protein